MNDKLYNLFVFSACFTISVIYLQKKKKTRKKKQQQKKQSLSVKSYIWTKNLKVV